MCGWHRSTHPAGSGPTSSGIACLSLFLSSVIVGPLYSEFHSALGLCDFVLPFLLWPHPHAIMSWTALGVFAAPPRATVLILMDDLGYNELGFQNSSRGLITPHLDSLASGGVRLTSYYTHPLCSPTRGALMTGRYSHRLGLQSNVVYWDIPWGVSTQRDLPAASPPAGYARARHERAVAGAIASLNLDAWKGQ